MIIGMQVTAAENIYVREYSYKASELDSKVSARKNALDQVKALLLEEIATYVYTSSSSTQSLGADYQKQFVQNVKNISAGFLSAKILDENWDGNIFWLRAEIHADPGKILDELKTALNTVPATSTYDVADTSTVMPVHRNYVQKAHYRRFPTNIPGNDDGKGELSFTRFFMGATHRAMRIFMQAHAAPFLIQAIGHQ